MQGVPVVLHGRTVVAPGVSTTALARATGALDATSPYADRDMRYEWEISYGDNMPALLRAGYAAAAPCTREGHTWMRRPRLD